MKTVFQSALILILLISLSACGTGTPATTNSNGNEAAPAGENTAEAVTSAASQLPNLPEEQLKAMYFEFSDNSFKLISDVGKEFDQSRLQGPNKEQAKKEMNDLLMKKAAEVSAAFKAKYQITDQQISAMLKLAEEKEWIKEYMQRGN